MIRAISFLAGQVTEEKLPLEILLASADVINGIIQVSEDFQYALNRVIDPSEFPSVVQTTTLHPAIRLVYSPDIGRCAIADYPILKGETVSYATGTLISRPIRFSRQIGNSVHVIGNGAINHNCADPTCVVDPSSNNLVAARIIGTDEMVTFNYLTSEMSMAEHFKCGCWEVRCYGVIRGFTHLDLLERSQIINRFPVARHIAAYFKHQLPVQCEYQD